MAERRPHRGAVSSVFSHRAVPLPGTLRDESCEGNETWECEAQERRGEYTAHAERKGESKEHGERAAGARSGKRLATSEKNVVAEGMMGDGTVSGCLAFLPWDVPTMTDQLGRPLSG